MNWLLKLLLNKQTGSDQAKAAAQQMDEEFIPYVCHYNPNTILTKNGELLQIIRVTGFSNSSVISEIISLRDSVRDAITDHIPDNKFAFWFSTIRRKKNITSKVTNEGFKDIFSKKLDGIWNEQNQWHDQYVNELYITIIIEGLDTSITNFDGFLRSFSYLATRAKHRKFLEESHKKLQQVVQNITNEIKDYGAKVLGIVEWEDVLYSEPMRFFGKILNLYEERYPLSVNDISSDLASHKIAFGNRELEVLGYNNKNFATIFSLKEYFEVSTNSLDRILQLPLEFIITQSFDFTYNKKDIDQYDYQSYVLKTSGDEQFRKLSGIANFLDDKEGSATDYGKLQTTIMLIAKTKDRLESDIKSALEQLGDLGFVTIREDIFSEHCFWAQLPGNFSYLRRQKIINTTSVGGFAALHSFSSGIIAGNHWGPPVTVLKTIVNTPYFFNFHDGDLGHTLVIGSHKNQGISILNFLIAQSRRFGGKLFYLDLDNRSKCFIKAMRGSYHTISRQAVGSKEFLRLNPFLLPKTPENKSFLDSFITSLVSFLKDHIPENEIKLIPQIVDRILVSNARDMATAAEVFNNSETKTIHEKLALWDGGKLGHIFGSKDEVDWTKNNIHGFDLSEISTQKPILIPIVNYLLHIIENLVDGKPSILVLNEFLEMIDNPILGPKIIKFLAIMRQKNCIVILTTNNIDSLNNKLTPELKKNIATEIFLPNHEISDTGKQVYKNIFKLSDDELGILKVMEDKDGHFFLKHGLDSVIAKLDLNQSLEMTKILDADITTLTAMDEVIKANTTDTQQELDPEIWLPQLYELLKEIENARLQEEKERLKEIALAQHRKLKTGYSAIG